MNQSNWFGKDKGICIIACFYVKTSYFLSGLLSIIQSYTYCSDVQNITGGTLFFPQFWMDLDESWQEVGPWDPNNRKKYWDLVTLVMVAMVMKKHSQFSNIPLIEKKCTRKAHNGWEQNPEIPVAMKTNMLLRMPLCQGTNKSYP